MTYFKVSSLKIFFLVAIFITGCGGGGGTSNNTDEIDTTSDRPTFNRELAAKAPFYSPSGSITNTKPSFKWLPVPNATDYRLGYEDTDTATNWIERTESASNANCNVLCSLTFVGTPFSVGDEKAWWVRPKVNGIWLDWSRANIFEIIDTVNSNTNPEVISPIGEISTVNPEFSWTSVSNVSRYNFGFESPNNQSDWKSYMLRPSEINCSETSCSFTPTDSGLVVGDIKRWWVRAESNYVWGEWSEGSDFSIEDSNSAARPFIITVKGYERSGRYATVQRDFTINTDSRYSYNYNVDCDSDGTLEASNLSSDYTCVYNDQAPNFNEHSVSISGQFPAFTQANTNFYGPISNNSKMIISVNQWGSQVWRTMENAFYDSSLETIKATDTPNLTQVESLHGMFRQSTFPKTVNDGANNLVNWNVSNVTDMSQMFYRSFNANPDISTWDVSNVKDLSGMFYNANAFNQDIGNWDVSNVTKINGLFEVASTFNQDIGNWNTSNIKEMIGTFASARAFNQNISNWDVNNVTNMYGMFSGAEKFNQDIGAWNVSNVINMQSMFNAARAFNQDIGNWDVSSVTDMTGMFNFANAFNQNIGSWDVSNVRSMKGMFGGYAGGTTNAKVFNQPIGEWDVSNVTDMSEMFANTVAFNQDLSNWDVSSVTDMRDMFNTAIAFNKPIGSWDVSNVESMRSMFENATVFNQSLANWNVSKVNNMMRMFKDTENFDQDIGNWDMSRVSSVFQMFAGVPFVTLSTDNYDKLLIGWSNQGLRPNLSFSAGNSKYSANGLSARNKIINQFGWTISDGGLL